MRTPASELIDLALTQAIERYMEMEPDIVYDAIAKEWPDQMAALLAEFLFRATCGHCGGVPDFIEYRRENGFSNYIAPICDCEWEQP